MDTVDRTFAMPHDTPTASALSPRPRCAVEVGLDALNGKWKGLILHFLMLEPVLRFNALKRRLPGVTQRMLTKQLRELEHEGLVVRTVYAEVPPRVDYRLAVDGERLRPVIDALRAWSVQREAARAAVSDPLPPGPAS